MVSKGREALEKAVKTIHDHPTWGGRVVYGDTDSVFVLLKGRSKAEAFDLGEEMARVISLQSPKPMKLKFEKVYLPCILQTKKRYVGYMWETREQAKPVYDAKGIETVRRDGIPATVKILEKTLRILFQVAEPAPHLLACLLFSWIDSSFHTLLQSSSLALLATWLLQKTSSSSCRAPTSPWSRAMSRPSSGRSSPAVSASKTSPSPRSSVACLATGRGPVSRPSS